MNKFDEQTVLELCDEIGRVEGGASVVVESIVGDTVILSTPGKIYKATKVINIERFEKTGEWQM